MSNYTYKEIRRFKYQKYLKSEDWLKRRNELIKAKGECRMCGTKKRLLCHHLNYNCLGTETLDDVWVVCLRCHNKIHAGVPTYIKDRKWLEVKKTLNFKNV